ncbi:MAG TPA: exodeoxyribonuclease VII small subunit [Candidatus Dormibacteraeota bacterium]
MSEAQLTYEQALEALDRSLKALEEGDLSLEDALKAVDDARTYLKICSDRLEEAKRKIEVRPVGDAAAEPADGPSDGPPADDELPEGLFNR